MKKLLAAVLLFALLWSGYWFIASSGTRAGFESWFEARRAAGWQADYSDLSVKGYPSRVDVTLENPALADPATGLAWRAPFLQVFALSYRPSHVIVAFPDRQTISSPRQRLDLESSSLRASMVLAPGPALAFERAILASDALTITPDGRAPTALTGLNAALKREGDAQSARYRLAFNADGLAPPLPESVSLSSELPKAFETFRADATLTFSRPWDISAIEDSRPQPRRIELHLAEAEWGALRLAAAGTLDIGRGGTPQGTLTLKARNWRDILELAKASGALPASLADQIAEGLSLLARLSGNPETLDIPLTFSGGLVKIGPVPLGPAPRIFIR